MMTPQRAIAIQGLLLDVIEVHLHDSGITEPRRLDLIRLALRRYHEQYETDVAAAMRAPEPTP